MHCRKGCCMRALHALQQVCETIRVLLHAQQHALLQVLLARACSAGAPCSRGGGDAASREKNRNETKTNNTRSGGAETALENGTSSRRDCMQDAENAQGPLRCRWDCTGARTPASSAKP
jgi:hypothetical protein